MNLLVSIIKFLQAFCLLLIPILVIYCMLSIMETSLIQEYNNELGTLMAPLSALVAILNSILGPFVEFIKGFISLEFTLNQAKLDFTHIISAGLVFGFYHVLGIANNFLKFSEDRAKELKKVKERKKAEELVEQKILEEVNKFKEYRSTLIIMKLKKESDANNYLIKTNLENSTNEISYVEEVFKSLSLYGGVRFENLDNNDNYYLNFNNINNAIKFIFETKEKVKKLNEKLHIQGIAYSYNIFAENFMLVSHKETEFKKMEKLLYLVGQNEIVIAEMFKKYYECFVNDETCKFDSKGEYFLNDEKCIEIFSLKKYSN